MTRWLTGLSLAVTLGVLLLGGSILLDLRAEAWRKSEQAADNLVITLSRDIARNITLYDLSIQGAIKALAEPALNRTDPTIRHMALFDTSATAEFLGSILVLDADGNVTDDSRSIAVTPINAAHREHFYVHKNRPDVGLFISRAFEGRLLHDTVIALTRRITNPDGSFGGIVEGAMRTAYFNDLFAKLDIGAKGSVSLFRSDGRLIMRRPYHPEEIDQDLSNAPTFQAFRTMSHGHFVGTSALDKVERLYTLHHIENLPLYISVAVAVEDIYVDWWHRAASIGAILVALCATSVALCLLFRREIQRRLKAEQSLHEAAQNLSVMAATDGLTGIPNRRSFEDALEQEWRRSIRSETSLAVLMLDVDCFKLFNDCYGHQMGDDVLKSVTACITGKLHRPADTAARYGGEEFIALLPETEMHGALTVADSIRSAVRRPRDRPRSQPGWPCQHQHRCRGGPAPGRRGIGEAGQSRRRCAV